jgi:soluble lytic murein transglycosylase
MRKHWAKIIPARWYSVSSAALCVLGLGAAQVTRPALHAAPQSTAAPAGLAALVRAYRESPTPARLAVVEAYAAAHSKETNGALARLALAVTAYEQKDYAAALSNLRMLSGKLPSIADYAAYYLGAARVESNDMASVDQDLAPVHGGGVASPFAGRAWLLQARARKATDAAEAVRLLREHYAELPQPEGDVNLADCYQAAGELAHAADFYQRVYYQYVSGDAAMRAAAALLALKDSMGAAYPPPLPQQMLQRANRLLDVRDYGQARGEYQSLAGQLTGVERNQARVRVGAADFLSGNTASAYPYLRGLDLGESEADAERLYYLEECARRLTDEDDMLMALKRLGQRYPHAPWRLRALVSAANRFLLANRPSDYVPLYQAVYENFPDDPAAAPSHWKVAFQAYLESRKDASDLLREHLQKYPAHASAGAALYFLARSAETENDFASAGAFYARLASAFPNTYYAVLARQRLSRSEIQGAPAAPKAAQLLASLMLPEPKPVPAEASSATTTRIDRSRLLRTAGLSDLADAELRFSARTDGQPALLGMEMAGSADAPYQGLRMMKSMASDYLNLPLAGAPRKFWELLFPLPYREEVVANARTNDLDPYLVAGLIRQESEFNPQALSRANAYGLTQVRPGTGRDYAKRAGVVRFTNRVLFQPATNLKIGTVVLRSMLDRNGGNLEQTLASYNAGPNRAAEWLTWKTYREPAEFVESIPFTETREYVQAVLRNADIYRRLYQ